MKKRLHTIFVVLVLGIFLVSAVRLVMIYSGYRKSKNTQQEAVAQFTRVSAEYKPKGAEGGTGGAPDAPQSQKQPSGGVDGKSAALADEQVYAPIVVDFTRLKEVSKDAVGWIYCEGTVINYPVVYGRDNEYYLERNYLENYDPSGAIFTDMRNENGFEDNNVILYGHHMQNGTMFATLKNWFDPAYLEEHPVMWLLTPEQDYRVELFAGYVTSAESDTYSVFHEPGQGLENYLNWVKKWSAIQTGVETEADAHYVVLSTCAYSSENARTALHGKLVPIDSAGGVPLR